MGNVVKWKTIGKFILKSDFLIFLILVREGVFLLISCCGGGGGGHHHQSKRYCTPPFNLSRKTSLIGPTLVSCTKMDFVFVFFSLGLGLGSRVRIKMWIMWNTTQPPLHQCWTHNFPPTDTHKQTQTLSDLPYRVADALLEAYSKRNPIVVLHNVYMDQNQSCLADWYGNKHAFLEDFLYMF